MRTLYTFPAQINRGVLISHGWNRRIPLYTEVSSFHKVGIATVLIVKVSYRTMVYTNRIYLMFQFHHW